MKPSARYHVDVTPNAPPEEIALHTVQVWRHAQRVLGDGSTGQSTLISFLARDDDGQVVGGLLARIQMGVFFVDAAWVLPEVQRSGVGRVLRDQVFRSAKEKGCACLVATTFEFFDAIDYLMKTDPEVKTLGTIENCSEGHSFSVLYRRL